MSLISDFVQFNALALEVTNTISAILVSYLKEGNKDIYKDVYDLVSKYGVVFDKLYKRKNSQINVFLNGFNNKRKAAFSELKAPRRDEVLALASEKTIPYILNNYNQYVPFDEKSRKEMSDKLFPIVKELEINSITSLYRELKNKINNMNEIDKESTLAYLQQMFVGYLISKLSHNPMNKYSRVRNMWTYESVCKMLKEPVLQVPEQNNKSR